VDPDDYTAWFNQTFPFADPKATCNLDWNDWPACPYYYEEYMHPTAWTTRAAVNVLDDYFKEGNTGNPLLLKVSYHRPHSPYDPPRRIFEQYLDGGSKADVPQLDRFANDSSWDQKYKEVNMSQSTWAGNPGHQAARHTRAGYLASVEFVDEHIGHLFTAIREKGLWDDFMIVWVSDHGDQNGDHYLWRKGFPWEASVHVRMVMKLPDSADQPARSSYAVTELRDVAPTLYDLTGVLDKVQAQDSLMNGKSLVPILKGHQSSVREWIDLELGRTYNATNHWNALIGYLHGTSGTTCSFWKYIFNAYDASEQLFCLSDDPNETFDLAALNEYQDTLVTWRTRLILQFKMEGRGKSWVVNNTLPVRPNSALFGDNYPCNGDRRNSHLTSRTQSSNVASVQ
jgi:arylsulfatase A-like enzyme